ncbi:helix-turn-helix domain-containing protein [Pseudomonas mediterranea]|uniref:helix-turn-helix domain-containing protein n=1 Tax=Pseudomonas mediterranea TaxID=183795 RepID=UPI000A55A31A|nr:helix-turn-helix domain-containing protein [Pseudomonas mediterranea]MDU9027648.1 helix-turn-helix domain-containing protein [Pseudomonas mediterranea]
MTENYLKIPTISLTQVAQMLGYADVSTVSRAFHRWFGVSPLEWRRVSGLYRQP